ncbi:N-acetylglucosamine-6-phosphate deacetylase [Novosphingobium sp. PS1R-30]|uniref:N-acetylglucosamine-6-phosphate deacetylase n=1 Tax=Novosphingobium anseongense TaxID=3133436 RepID=A0ABU8S0I2_9SPHN
MPREALCGARVHVAGKLVEGYCVVVENGRIAAIVAEAALHRSVRRRELAGGTLAAGFIDCQVNGGGGILFNDAPELEALETIGAAHRRFGTTGFLPTIISDDIEVVARAIDAVRSAIEDGVPGILGIHIEGPMLAPSRHGIHDPRFFRGADRAMLELVAKPGPGRRLVTVAPEIVGEAAIRELAANGVIVSVGHTEATYDEARKAFAAGVTGVTHLFNAMSGLVNRAPGVVGAALENQHAWCGIIVDGVHVHPAMLRVALRCRPIDRFMLVTDAMSPVGTEMRSFNLQGREIQVGIDRCVDENGILAGSNLTMGQAVRNVVGLLELPLSDALTMAAAAPADFLGLRGRRGRIAVGEAADLVWLDEDVKVGATWIGGEEYREGEL